MRLLEGQLGRAVERSPRGSKLTPVGALVAGWAPAAVDAAAVARRRPDALRRERDSRLRIAASMTVAEYLLPAWLTALRAVDPGAVVALSAVNSAEVTPAVLADAADIGFVEGPGSRTACTPNRRPGRAHPRRRPVPPWARRRIGVPAAELARTALVSREPGRAPGAIWRRRCAPGRPGARALGRRAVVHHRDQGRGRRRGRPGRAQLARRRGRTGHRDVLAYRSRRGSDPPAPRGVAGAAASPGRPWTSRDRDPFPPPPLTPGMNQEPVVSPGESGHSAG